MGQHGGESGSGVKCSDVERHAAQPTTPVGAVVDREHLKLLWDNSGQQCDGCKADGPLLAALLGPQSASAPGGHAEMGAAGL